MYPAAAPRITFIDLDRHAQLTGKSGRVFQLDAEGRLMDEVDCSLLCGGEILPLTL